MSTEARCRLSSWAGVNSIASQQAVRPGVSAAAAMVPTNRAWASGFNSAWWSSSRNRLSFLNCTRTGSRGLITFGVVGTAVTVKRPRPVLLKTNFICTIRPPVQCYRTQYGESRWSANADWFGGIRPTLRKSAKDGAPEGLGLVEGQITTTVTATTTAGLR